MNSFVSKVYDNSPVIVQNLLASIQGARFIRQRFDRKIIVPWLSKLLESQWWSEEEFRRFQLSCLRERLTAAFAEIPYYKDYERDYGISPENINDLDCLRKLPLLEKSTIKEDPHLFLKGGYPDSSWYHGFTSGSTGTPMDIYFSRESFSRIWTFIYRLRTWAGLSESMHPRRVQFTGRDICPQARVDAKGIYWRHNFADNALLFSTSHISSESAMRYLDAISRFQPDLIDGYPSAIAALARLGRGMDAKVWSPKGIIVSAETLLEQDKLAMESYFGARVFNQYASSETSSFICSCEAGNMHINPEFGIVEILKPDGSYAGPGEEGEIVTTPFWNKEQFFLRYRIGDSAVLASEACPCGRKMPTISAVTGRLDDVLFVPERGYVGRLDPVFKGLHSIHEAQIIQNELERFTVAIVPASGYTEDIKDLLENNLRSKLGKNVTIDFSEVVRIPRGPNGKFRSVVSHCRDRYPKDR